MAQTPHRPWYLWLYGLVPIALVTGMVFVWQQANEPFNDIEINGFAFPAIAFNPTRRPIPEEIGNHTHGPTIWSDNLDPWTYEWTTTDFTITKHGSDTPAYSWHNEKEDLYTHDKERFDADPPQEVTAEYHLTLLSVVGPLVSLEEEAYEFSSTMAHPGMVTRYQTLDTRTEPFKPLSALELVDAQGLYQALLDHELVSQWLEQYPLPVAGGEKTPSWSNQLKNLVSHLHHHVQDCQVSVPMDMLTRYRIDAYEPTQKTITLTFGLSHGCEADRGHLTLISITAPVAEDPLTVDSEISSSEAATLQTGWTGWLDNAQTRAYGFLFSDQSNIVGKQDTLYYFESRGNPQS